MDRVSLLPIGLRTRRDDMVTEDIGNLALCDGVQCARLSKFLNSGIVRSEQGDILLRCDLCCNIGILSKQADQSREAAFTPKQCGEVHGLCRSPKGKCCSGYESLGMHVDLQIT